MHKRNRWFVTISLIYGLLGGLVALTQLIAPGLIPGNVARMHGHIMLLGFILMMIYGVALHVLPRFFRQCSVFGTHGELATLSCQCRIAAHDSRLAGHAQLAGAGGWRDCLFRHRAFQRQYAAHR